MFEIDILKDHVFSDPVIYLYHFIDNIPTQMQVDGNYTISHNSLRTEDISALFYSYRVSKNDAFEGLFLTTLS